MTFPTKQPLDDSITMKWFRNIPAGQPWTPPSEKKAYSADYSLQLMMGYKNFLLWKKTQEVAQKGLISRAWYGVKVTVGTEPSVEELEEGSQPHRAGPVVDGTQFKRSE